MPGGDGTGPRGEGPLTGRGLGFCGGSSSPGFAQGRGGAGWGRGWAGRGRGFWGRGRFWRSAPAWRPVPVEGGSWRPSKEEALAQLKAEKASLEAEAKRLEKEIESLESEGKN